jgi:hypothetical protein
MCLRSSLWSGAVFLAGLLGAGIGCATAGPPVIPPTISTERPIAIPGGRSVRPPVVPGPLSRVEPPHVMFGLVETSTGRPAGFTPPAAMGECVPSPVLPGDPNGRWGVHYRVTPRSSPVVAVSLCATHGATPVCFHSRPGSSRQFGEHYLPVPAESDPGVGSATLPRLRYELRVDMGAYTQIHRIEHKLAPLPQATLSSGRLWVTHQLTEPPPGFTRTTLSASFEVARAERVALLTVRSSGAGSDIEFGFIETAATVDRDGPPAHVATVPVSNDARRFRACLHLPWSGRARHEWDAGGRPVRVWAAAPLIEGCSLSAVSDPARDVRSSMSGPLGAACAGPGIYPEPVVSGGRPPPRGEGKDKDKDKDAKACTDADVGGSCEFSPPECNGPAFRFTVPGVQRCRGGRLRCEAAAPYCNHAGGDCGGAIGHACIRDADCAPGTVCGRADRPCDPRNGEACGQCRALTTWPDAQCELKRPFCWLPGGDWNNTDACIPSQGPDCIPRCGEGNCGSDGCGGTCGTGTCPAGQRCERQGGFVWGGFCLPERCRTDADCCTLTDGTCSPLGPRNCGPSGYCQAR